MGTYIIGLLVQLHVRAETQEEAEEHLALLVEALKKLGCQVDIQDFDKQSPNEENQRRR